MNSPNSLDPSSILDRLLAAVAQNLRIEKILLQLGLDPGNITFDAVANRLVDIGLAHITLANMLALIGAIFFVATLMVRTIVPLRIIGIISNVFLIAYGALAGSISAQGDLSMDWLRPFMTPRKYSKGDVLFHKGDPANEMFLTVSGRFLVSEIGIELPPGRMMGELGFVDPKNRRTQTVECIENADVLTITYEKLLELYFQNQEFGYYFLRLTTERLMQNISRLEATVDAKNRDIARLEGLLAARTVASQ